MSVIIPINPSPQPSSFEAAPRTETLLNVKVEEDLETVPLTETLVNAKREEGTR